MTRRLLYIPILHTEADMGALSASLRHVKLSTMGRQRLARSRLLVEKSWEEIEGVVARLDLRAGNLRVYQDGLPVCGREPAIVAELAQAGSRNHRLLLALQNRGAILMGTESPELLLEEYQLAAATLLSGERRHTLGAALLERRDRFVADRIHETLAPGETGVLFMGMLHAVDRFLPPEIQISYPLRKQAWAPKS